MNTRLTFRFTRTSSPWLAAPAASRKRGGSPSAWLRAVAAFLIPIQILTLQPALLWAATAPDPAAPAILAAPGTGMNAPYPPGPLPDLALLQSEEAKLAIPLAPLNRTLPPGAGGYVTPPLPENPTDAQLLSCALLPEPLVLNGETWPEENAALSKALRAFAHRSNHEDWSSLTSFLISWPESAWRASIQLQLGKMYLERSYTTRAVKVLKEAAAALKNAQGVPLERLQGQVAVQLAKALAKSGRITEAAPVVAAMANRPQWGSVGEELRQLGVTTAPRKKTPSSGGTCGVMAVKSLYAALLPYAPMPKVLVSAAEQKRLKLVPEGDKGMSLKQLATFANAAAMPLLPAKRKDGEWVIPSIIHWKSEHYSVLIKKQGNRCLVRDPLLGGDFWLSEAALADETTGFALLGVPKLPKGWVAPTVAQLNATIGRQDGGASPTPGSTPTPTPQPTPCKPCSDSVGGGGEGGPKTGDSGCSSCPGMPNYSLYLAQASLGITDTPIAYSPAVGPALNFTLHYFQRNIPQPVPGESDFVGQGWTTGLLSYVDETLFHVSAVGRLDGVSGGQVPECFRYIEISGSARVFLPGGGEAVYEAKRVDLESKSGSDGGQEHLDGCPNTATFAFLSDASDHSTLTRFGGRGFTGATEADGCGCVPATGLPLRYERRMTDGTIYRYGAWGNTGAVVGEHAYLASITDPAQHAMTFSYWQGSAGCRLLAVTAADAVSMIFEYNDNWHTNAITDVLVSGRHAHLQYDDAGRLSAITDAIGMTSRFGYAYSGIVAMDTPYGHTAFASGGDTNGNLWVQATQIVDGIPAKQRVELRVSELLDDPAVQGGVPPAQEPPENVPAGMNVRNADLNKRNSFYWDRKAMAEMGNPEPGGVFNYDKARVTHWMYDAERGILYDTPSSRKAPLESRVWYEYGAPAVPPDVSRADQFTAETLDWQATAVGRVVDGAGTLAERSQVRRYTYNEKGRVLTSTDPKGRETSFDYYATPNGHPIDPGEGELLTAVFQTTAAAIPDTLATYAGYNALKLPHTTTDAAGQATAYTYTGGRVERVTRKRNGVDEMTTYAYYDANGRALATDLENLGNAMRLYRIKGPGDVLLSTFTYDAAGRVLTITGADGYTVTNYYDALDRPVRTTYPDGTYEQTIYNKLDAEWQRDREGRWTHSEHNSQRQAVAVTDPLGRTTKFEWCPCGALEAIIDAAGPTHRTTFIRDRQSRVVQKVYADTTATLYEYEPKSGRLAWMQDARGQRTKYEYYLDNALKRVSYTDANDQTLEQTRPGDGTKINAPVDYFYDAFYNRIVRMHDGTGDTNYGYYPVNPGDAEYGDGRLAAVNGPVPNSLIAYTYDEYGRVKKRTIDGVNNETNRVFDALGRIVSETNPLGTFGYDYIGNTGRLQRVSNGQGFATEYEYHPNVPATAGTGDGDHRLSAIKHYRNFGNLGGTQAVDAEYDYHYTPGGNISQWKQRWDNLTAGNDYKLAYDPADQLRGAELTNPGSAVVRATYGYGYDAAANRTLEQTSTPTGAGASDVNLSRASYNNLNQLTSRTGGTGEMELEGTVTKPAKVTIAGQPATAEWKIANDSYGFKGTTTVSAGTNNIPITATTKTDPATPTTNKNTASTTVSATSSGTAIPALTYDENGNMLTDGTRTYEWDAASRLVTIIYAGTGNRTEFAYDGMGRRVRDVEITGENVSSTKKLIWNGLTFTEARDAANAVIERYYQQGEQRTAAVNLLYRRDHLGSVREATDVTGVLFSRLDYDLWGRRSVLAGPGTNEPVFGYTGHYFHVRSAVYLAPFRGYSAELGRWQSRDPLPDAENLLEGPNLYPYVGNSPLRYVDPMGLKIIWSNMKDECCKAMGGTSMPVWQANGHKSLDDYVKFVNDFWNSNLGQSLLEGGELYIGWLCGGRIGAAVGAISGITLDDLLDIIARRDGQEIVCVIPDGLRRVTHMGMAPSKCRRKTNW